MLRDLELQNFTLFKEIEIPVVSGINIFIGQNGTGKTHILKLVYSILASIQENRSLDEKLKRVFLPKNNALNRIIHKGTQEAGFDLKFKEDSHLKGRIFKTGQNPLQLSGLNNDIYKELFPNSYTAKPVYIPVKEMLANAPGFRSLYATREIHFEEIYFDIIDRALLPELKQLSFTATFGESEQLNQLIKDIQKVIGGKVYQRNEEFYIRTGKGEIEFSMLSEGHRKLALLWLLINNGSLAPGSVLFWDEPEANLNPSMLPVLVKVLLALERIGVQIFIATHNYELLKEFDLQKQDHSLIFNALHFKDKEIQNNQSQDYVGLDPNVIEEQFTRLYDLEIKRSFGRKNG